VSESEVLLPVSEIEDEDDDEGKGGVWATPRPVPHGMLPAIAGSLVVLVALPVFLVAGWPMESWEIAAALWVAYLVIGAFLSRVPLGDGNLAAAGLVAVGRVSRAGLLMVVLITIAVKSSHIGLPAAIVYGLAFTVEFLASLYLYFDGEAGK
jgi:hypothetical protein